MRLAAALATAEGVGVAFLVGLGLLFAGDGQRWDDVLEVALGSLIAHRCLDAPPRDYDCRVDDVTDEDLRRLAAPDQRTEEQQAAEATIIVPEA